MYETALVINDLHIPFHDPAAVQLALEVAEAAKVSHIYINGDLLDCWDISKYHKSPAQADKANLKREIGQGRAFLANLRARFSCPIDYIYGNHEHRWEVFIVSKARELVGLDGLTLAEQLRCKEQDIQVHYSGLKETFIRHGRLLIGHFDSVNKHSAYTAKNLLEKHCISGIQGHTHRGGSSFKRLFDRDIVFYENFCLCDRNPCYTSQPNWQLGFCLVHTDTKSDFFYVEPKPIVETPGPKAKKTYRVYHNGKCFSRTA